MALRDIKRQARRDLHQLAQIPAFYIRTPNAAPVLVHVRLHDHFGLVGAIKGARTYPAEMENENPKIKFDLAEVSPVRGAIVSIAAGEAYQVDHAIDPDDQFQYAYVTKLTGVAAAGLPVPPLGTV